MILEREIKDAKMSIIKHQFPLNFLYEMLMSLRIKIPVEEEYFERGSTSEQKIVIGY